MPDRLHTLTATVLLALTRIIPIKPLSKPAGHPGATESPADAPGPRHIVAVQVATVAAAVSARLPIRR